MRCFVLYLTIMAMLSAIVWQSEAAPILNPGNGHYYEVFAIGTGLIWTEAKTAAESLTFMGISGHLATITSQEENDFISTTFGPHAPEFWLGGFQPPGSPEPGGNWQWVTGEAFSFTNWYPGEPNDAGGGGNEPYLEMRIFLGSQWNDNDSFQKRAYLVEWDTPIPVPSTLVLFSIAALGIIVIGWRGRQPSG